MPTQPPASQIVDAKSQADVQPADMDSRHVSSVDVAGPKDQQYDAYKQPTGDLPYQTSNGQGPNAVDTSVQDATASEFKPARQLAQPPAPTASVIIVPQNIQPQLTATLPPVARINLQPMV